MADLFSKILQDPTFELARMATEMGLYPYYVPLSDSEGTVVEIEGHDVIMLGSNNYLGLTTHPKVKQAAQEAIDHWGTSCTGSRMANGTLTIHVELDRRLAELVGKEDALVFSTGFQSNLGTISAVVGKGDYVIIDREAHASIVDGSLLARGRSQAVVKRFTHSNPESLDRVLKDIPDDAGRLVVVDGVYSMGGDIAPLPELVEICRRNDARLMVDDAHSVGVLANGRGTAAHFGLTEEVDLIMGTFSKSFASIGGFIAGDKDIITFIKHNARAMMFSASLPASNVATVLACLDIIESEPEHVERLWENTRFVRAGYKKMGFDIGNTDSPIIPIYIREQFKCARAWRTLLDAGVYTNAAVPPGVPASQSLLRTSYMATHTREHLTKALDIFEQVGKALELIAPDATWRDA